MPARQEINEDARPDGSVTLRWEPVIYCPFCGVNHNSPDVYPDQNTPSPVDCWGCGRTFWYTWEGIPFFHCHPENPDANHPE